MLRHQGQRVFQIAVALLALFNHPHPEGAFFGLAFATALITGSVSLRSRKSSPVFLPITAAEPP